MVGDCVGWLDDLNIRLELVRTVDLPRPEAVPNIRLDGSKMVVNQMDDF